MSNGGPDTSAPDDAVLPCTQQIPAHWVEIELKDESGSPVPYQEYMVTLPDGEIVTGYLDAEGFERLEFEASGSCKITFPRLDSRAWKYQSSTGPKQP